MSYGSHIDNVKKERTMYGKNNARIQRKSTSL